MSDTLDTDTRDQIADTPWQLPADVLEQLHVADLFGEATPPGVTLDASTNRSRLMRVTTCILTYGVAWTIVLFLRGWAKVMTRSKRPCYWLMRVRTHPRLRQ